MVNFKYSTGIIGTVSPQISLFFMFSHGQKQVQTLPGDGG